MTLRGLHFNDPTTFRSGRKFSTSSPWLFVLFESGPVPAASGLHGSERPTHGAPPRVPDSGAPLSSGLRGCRVIGGFPSDPRVVSSPGLSFLFPRRETHNVPVTERIPESLAQIIGDRQPQRSPGQRSIYVRPTELKTQDPSWAWPLSKPVRLVITISYSLP